MRLAALTVPHRFGDPDAQFLAIDAALVDTRGVDLVALPETALTGYVSPGGDYDLRAFAEPAGGPSEKRLAALAEKHRTALLGPVIERGEGGYYNGVVLFDAQGHVVFRYRKRHPWMPESSALAGEPQLPVVDFHGLALSACICFDIHFVAEESEQALSEADVLLFPSAWSDLEDTRPDILVALARRFALTVVNANWGLGVPRVPGQGESLIVNETTLLRSNRLVVVDL